MTTTYNDIRAEVEASLPAEGDPLREGIDLDAITAEIIHTYGLIHIDATDEDDEPVISNDDYWNIVRRHDATQA